MTRVLESTAGLADNIETACTAVVGIAAARVTDTTPSAPAITRDVVGAAAAARVETNTIVCVALTRAAHAPFIIAGTVAAIPSVVGPMRGRCKWEWALVV
jgi:hypothetical protein